MSPSGCAGHMLPSAIPELLQDAAPHLPPGLNEEAARVRRGALLPALPPAATIGAFECRLEAGARQVDFEICIRAADGGRAALAAGLDALAASVAGDARWARTIDFLRAWCDPGSVLFDTVPVVWLEFDLDDAHDGAPAPFVVVTLAPGLAFAEGTAVGPTAARALAEAFARLAGGGLGAATERAFARCIRELPAGGRLLHVALRPEDGGELLRVIVTVPWETIPAYLARLDWPGDGDELQQWLAATCTTTLMHSLNLDLVGGAVGPRVGVEYYFPTSPADDPRWATLFDALAAAGACTPERRAQLTAWPSQGERPRGLVQVDRELLIKVVHERDRPLRAKAYLPFAPRVNPAALDAVRAFAQADQRPGA